jgi:hypothetical protein
VTSIFFIIALNHIAIDIEEEVEVPEFDDVLVNNDMIFLEAEKLDDSIDDEQDDDCFDEDTHFTNRDIVMTAGMF